MRLLAILALIVLCSPLLLAATWLGPPPSGLTGVRNSITDLCTDLKNLLPVVAMLMVVIAGVIYSAGQIMGAETRARANVWATAALVGAIIGLLIYAIAPPVLQAIYDPTGTQFTC